MNVLLSIPEAAARYRVSARTVRRHAREALRKLGRRTLVDPNVLEKLCTSEKTQFIVPAAERSLNPKGEEMIQRRRWQEGAVYLYEGRRVKTWYGVYREDVRTADGVRRRQRNVRLGSIEELRTKSHARRKLRELITVAPTRTEMTFSELVSQFEKVRLPKLKPSTGRYRMRMLRLKQLEPFNACQLSQVTRLDIEQLTNEVSGTYSESVVRGLLSSLSQLFAWAVSHGWVGKNVAEGVDLPRDFGGKRVKRYPPTQEQVARMVLELPEPYATLVLLLYSTGLRIGEALALRHEDFTADGGLLIQRRILDGEVDTPKTKRSRRRLPIPADLILRLKSLSKDSWIFQSQNGSPLNPKNALNRFVKKAAQAVGMESVNWHSFRHAFTVTQRRSGTHPKILSSLLGHASVVTQMDAYDTPSDAELQQPLNQLLQSVMKSQVTAWKSVNCVGDLAAPQGFEPRYADPESAVLPLNEGAALRM